MSVALWTVSGVLAIVFLGSGTAKVSMSRERLLATGQSGIRPFPMPVVRMTAVCEIAAAVGLFVPWLLTAGRLLTPAAAFGLCVVMAGAAVSHASLREPKQVALNLVLLGLAGFVAAGRMAQLY
jgi:uncharacterized membrane protein YphA (DoxX/SURF4 family)